MAMSVSDLTPVATRPVKTRFRRIATPIPVPESIDLIRRLREVEPQSMAGMVPIVWHLAQGFQVRDPYGNQWIDLSSGIVMANSGHAHPRILEAIRRQAASPLLFTYAYPAEVRRRLLERLVKLAPPGLNKAILFSSGTEANECAITLMRRHGQCISPRKTAIVSFEGNYHGRTLAAKAASGGEDRVDGIPRAHLRHFLLPRPGESGFAADLQSRGLDPGDVAGVILESIPGVTTACHPLEYVRELRAWATRHRVLIAVDEIQCGMGRTGKMFAIEHYGIAPDLITCGKGLSSSLPVSAVIGAREVMDLAPPGEMSSTFGGNPLCAAAAEANLELMEEEGLVERAAELGEQLERWLAPVVRRHARAIGQVNGRGLFYSIHLRHPATGEPWVEMADRVALECVRRGVLLFVTGRGFLKIVPPLTIDREALKEAVEVIAAVLDEELTA
jgi:4-aminobutyrate aminotransferase-like enzyme